MVYKVERYKRKLPTVLKNKWGSYEEARNAVRKWLLAKYGHRTLSLEGFSVVKG